MTKDEAVRLALEALERGENQLRWEAITTIKKVLAQPERGHVAHIYYVDPNGRPRVGWDNWNGAEVGDKLYALPVQREWVGLTEEEKQEAYYKIDTWDACVNFVTDKLKEKNT